jgi:hypothetical protein
MGSFEMRLLRSFLGGLRESCAEKTALVSVEGQILEACSIEEDRRTGRGDKNSAGSASLEEGNSDLVGHIESGYYAKVFASSRCWSLLLDGLPPFDSKLEGNMQNAAKYFYNALESRISEFLGSNMGEATADEVDLVELQQRSLLVLVLGVAALCIFVQANLTG